jgi:hypothetical protein
MKPVQAEDLDVWAEVSAAIANRQIGALKTAGFAVVPVEPTEEMANAGEEIEIALDERNIPLGSYLAKKLWSLMLERAPKP